jgi:hypothetical protein
MAAKCNRQAKLLFLLEKKQRACQSFGKPLQSFHDFFQFTFSVSFKLWLTPFELPVTFSV